MSNCEDWMPIPPVMPRALRPSTYRARQLRRSMTPAEAALWAVLRVRPHGCKFRRQHPLGPFVADFYCHEVALVIEADGPIHLRRRERDGQRDRFMELCGIEVLRLSNAQILEQSEATLRLIERTLLRLLAPLSLRERGWG